MSPWLVGLAALLAAAIFVIDLLLPMGDAGGVPYVALVCLGWWHSNRSAIYVAAGIATTLILIGFVLSPSDFQTVLGLSNRVLAVIAIWITAALLGMARRAQQDLEAANDELDSLVRMRTRALEQEIAERKQAEAIITHMANHDSLTGLPIRSLFLDRLAQALATARRNRRLVAVLFIDLDDFKAVNDTLGHDAGDQLLREAAQRLQTCVRETVTVARHGGDEFTVVLTDISGRSSVGMVAQKMLDVLSQPFDLHRGAAQVGCSVGIAIYPANGEQPESLLERADVAMYAAKEGGKNTFTFSSETEARAAS